MADFFDRLRASSGVEWASYVEHPFVEQLAAGVLPTAAFQAYLVQDYLFLIQFARAKALAVYKSRSLVDMRAAQAGLSAILDIEMDLHVRLCERWGFSAADLEAAAEHRATIAYTRFVLDCGLSGDLLDLQVALSPCIIGYAEIAARIASRARAVNGHPYIEWIEEYAGYDYQAVAAGARKHLDQLAERAVTKTRFGELSSIFAKASRLEADFWQMGLDATKGATATV